MSIDHDRDRLEFNEGPGLMHVLDRFFAIEAARVTPRTAQRYRLVQDRLGDYLAHVDVADHLGTGEAALLDLERLFGRDTAFARLFGIDELVCCLPGFLSPRWLASAAGERRAQIALTGRLLGYLRRRGLIDFSRVACAFYEAQGAVYAARDAA